MGDHLAQSLRMHSLRRIVWASGLAGVLLVPGPATADCSLEAGESGIIEQVRDGATATLSNGTEIRLIAALPPSPSGQAVKRAGLAEAARARLEDLILGREVMLRYGGRREDRHGRRLAHLFAAGEPPVWVQAELVDSGLARVYSFADNRACVEPLLELERGARAARRGIWSDHAGTIHDADRPWEISADVGEFAIVEGRVLSVGERRARTYLNFGTYWNEDFTVIATGRDRDRFAEAGLDLGALTGRLVRVRGWILDDRGPAIEATHPEQIEIVDDE